MIVSCPACSTRYNLPPQQLGSKGRKVRCKKCGHNWIQAPAGAAAEAPATASSPSELSSARTVQPPAALRADDESGTASAPPFDREPADDWGSRLGGAFDGGFGGGFGEEQQEPERGGRGRRLMAAARSVLQWLGLAAGITGLVVFMISARTDIVALWPPAARLYDAVGLTVEPPGAGLQLQNVKSEQQIKDGAVMLVVEGQIVNVSELDRDVPAVLAVSIGPDHKPVHKWRIPVSLPHLAPGAIATFRSIERDPGVVSEVAVTFDGG